MRIGADALTEVRPLRPEDREPLRAILVATGVFSPEEIETAQELMNSHLANEPGADYEFAVAEGDNQNPAGYYCIGPTPLTDGTYDLYWIAVRPSAQRRGIGTLLIEHAESAVRARGGRLLLAETSSLPRYGATREFYVNHRFMQLARIKDYYRPGDDLIVYGKYLSQPKE